MLKILSRYSSIMQKLNLLNLFSSTQDHIYSNALHPLPPKPPQMQHIPPQQIQIRPPVPALLKKCHPFPLGAEVLTHKSRHSGLACATVWSDVIQI